MHNFNLILAFWNYWTLFFPMKQYTGDLPQMFLVLDTWWNDKMSLQLFKMYVCSVRIALHVKIFPLHTFYHHWSGAAASGYSLMLYFCKIVLSVLSTTAANSNHKYRFQDISINFSDFNLPTPFSRWKTN